MLRRPMTSPGIAKVDHLPGDVVPLRQAVQRLAGQELRGHLPLERGAM